MCSFNGALNKTAAVQRLVVVQMMQQKAVCGQQCLFRSAVGAVLNAKCESSQSQQMKHRQMDTGSRAGLEMTQQKYIKSKKVLRVLCVFLVISF